VVAFFRWFGLVLLPLISFSGDGVITFSYAFQNMFFHHGKEPHALADAKPIDLSIQFALFWTPLFILIGWWIGKPLPLLFGAYRSRHRRAPNITVVGVASGCI
jgi:Ca2+:H+ antiporter